MKATTLGLFLVCAAAVPAAATPFDGAWYMVCSDNPADAFVPVVIDGNRITNYESECTIASVTPVGTGPRTQVNAGFAVAV
jgi:hypothetical protein